MRTLSIARINQYLRLSTAWSGTPRWRRLALPMGAAAWIFAFLPAPPVWALTLDSSSRVHAVIGQPLSVQLPLHLSGTSTSNVDIQVTPTPGLADDEKKVAETVIGTYDPIRSVIHLTTTQRVVVPVIRLHLSVSTESVAIDQDVDVLVDLPDFNKQFERPDVAVAVAPDTDTGGIRVLTVQADPHVARFGDTAARDPLLPGDADRPVVTGSPIPAPAVDAAAAPAVTRVAEARQKRTGALAPAATKLAPGQAPTVAQPQPTADSPGAHADFFKALLKVTAGVMGFFALALLGRRGPSWLRAARRQWPQRTVPHLAGAGVGPSASVTPVLTHVTGSDAQEIAHLHRILTEQPWRSDLRYQLAQRLYKARDAAAFGEIAVALKPALSEDLWRRVRAMGHELLPADSRFAE